MNIAPAIHLTEQERIRLLVWKRLGVSVRLALRAESILLAAEGKTNQQIAHQLGASPKTVSLWRRRFLQNRLEGIEREAPRGKPIRSN
ncbi:MAG: helix-turn-helix domain-containing protein [Thermoguttaceae bacterium]|nr:helix-turn-helix domain-containing protein [Thermoguttaceae bacterium]MDW8037050.1 helix-turn-helix domain-containing protein [Thermoguttaceae bacterium]